MVIFLSAYIPNEIIERAGLLISEERTKMEDVISRLEETESTLEREKRTAERKNAEAQRILDEARRTAEEYVSGAKKDDLQYCFREFLPFIGTCRFSTCSHVKDKGCKICEAVEAGLIEKSRHENYCALYEHAKSLKEWEL